MTAVLAVYVYAWVVGRTEKRPVTEVARKGAVGAVGRGVLLGTLVFASVVANIAFLGHYEVDGWGSYSGAVGLAGFMAGASVTEELLFRGVLFRTMEERFGTWGALIPTSVLFGAWHLLNPDASLWGATVIALSAGPMLGAAYCRRPDPVAADRLHFGWELRRPLASSAPRSPATTPSRACWTPPPPGRP
ncbi:CPBP family intramembrane metalloprotease OS=Streptomyces albaduncus OX=68172 GN=FHS32_004748 PE=4 SV=1 [Streptomyces griseoloalbus]